MSDFDEPESSESTGDRVSLNAETDGTCSEERSEERIAAVLLRVLGVYFLAWAIITGVDEAARLFLGLKMGDISLDDIVLDRARFLAYLAAEFAVGAYLLFGGRWVFEKVLMPIAPRSSEDEDADAEGGADDEAAGTHDPPGMETT